MTEHDATETAFNNGYKQAAREIFAEIEILFSAPEMPLGVIPCLASKEYDELKKKYTEN